MAAHEPVIVHDRTDDERLAIPSEICAACSDLESGRMVPASFCPEAKSKLGPPPWEG